MSIESFELLQLSESFDPYDSFQTKRKLDQAFAHFEKMLNYVCIRHPDTLTPAFAEHVDSTLAETWDYFDVRRKRG